MARVERLVRDMDTDLANRIGYTTETGISATGNDTQGSGFAITANINLFETVGATANTADLPEREACKRGEVHIVNAGANALNVYPASGDSINSQAANAKITVASGATAILWDAGSKWIGSSFA
jgi:hypothetical protein